MSVGIIDQGFAMTLWVVRAGRYGEREELALNQRMVVIGWEAMANLVPVCNDRKALAEELRATYPDLKPKTLSNWESQIWPFIAADPRTSGMKVGDIVGLPLKKKRYISIGRVTSEYKFRPEMPGDARHTREVQWLGEIARSRLDTALRYSFGGAMTVFRITKGDAEQTVLRLVGAGSKKQQSSVEEPFEESVATDAQAPLNIAETARDEIRAYITRRFKGHGLTRLVAAVLATQGYTVSIAPEGSDRGVDIIAGKGPLGFEVPRLVV